MESVQALHQLAQICPQAIQHCVVFRMVPRHGKGVIAKIIEKSINIHFCKCVIVVSRSVVNGIMSIIIMFRKLLNTSIVYVIS